MVFEGTSDTLETLTSTPEGNTYQYQKSPQLHLELVEFISFYLSQQQSSATSLSATDVRTHVHTHCLSSVTGLWSSKYHTVINSGDHAATCGKKGRQRQGSRCAAQQLQDSLGRLRTVLQDYIEIRVNREYIMCIKLSRFEEDRAQNII